MIQLELREPCQAKSQRQPSAARRVFRLSQRHLSMLAILVVLLLAVGFKAAYSYRIAHAEVLARRTSGQHDRELALVKAVYLDHQRGEGIDKDRLLTDQLGESQAGHPASSNAGNLEDATAVWLSGVKDQGASVKLEGTALTANAISTLISDLETTGYFTNIEIRETYREGKRKSESFQFELTCEFGSTIS